MLDLSAPKRREFGWLPCARVPQPQPDAFFFSSIAQIDRDKACSASTWSSFFQKGVSALH
jgi:hypothetical protein